MRFIPNLKTIRMRTNKKMLDNLKSKLLDNSLQLTAGVVSISAISYVLSRLFIKLYLKIISFESLGYSALSNNDTSSLFFFGILIILLATILLSTLVPACLRQIYLESEIPFNKVNIKIVNLLIIASFLIVFVTSIIYILYIQSALIMLLIAIFPITTFVYKYINTRNSRVPAIPIVKQKKSNFDTTIQLNKLKFYIDLNRKNYLINSIISGCLFALAMTLLIAPCFFLILFVDQSKFVREAYDSDILVIAVSSFIWLAYSFLCGSRITEPSPKHFLYDIFLSFALLYFLALINMSTFIISIAQFVDIKDNTARVYKISNQNYKEISENLDLFWKENYRNLTSEKLCQPLTKNMDNYNFLQAQIVYRDSDIVIVCPPDINLIKENTEQCFIADKDKIIPTSKSIEYLLYK